MIKKMKKNKWYIIIISVFTVIITFVITFLSIFSIITVQGFSMEPTIANGQVLLVNKYKSNHDFSDIIVFGIQEPKTNEDKLVIKRIIGLPSDTIQFKDNVIYRNGKALTYPFYKSLKMPNTEPFTVPKDHYFVLGDNVNASTDSRELGTISKDKIYGTKI